MTQPASPKPPMRVEFEGTQYEFPGDATDDEIAEALDKMQPATAATGAPIEVKGPDGTIVEFPANTPQDVMTGAMRRHYGWKTPAAADEFAGFPDAPSGGPAPRRPVEAEPSVIDTIMSFGKTADYAAGTAAQGLRGVRQGLAGLAGLPVDAVNNAPRLLNLLPGVDGVGPIAERPFGGSDSIDSALGGFGAIPEPAPAADAFQRGARRVGQEVGAAAVPVGGALVTAGRVGVQGARQLPGLARMFVEPAAVAPGRFVAKEAAAAGAAGVGASTAGELVRQSGTDPQSTAALTADIFGAIAGAGTLGVASHVIPKAAEVGNALRGSPNYTDSVVRQNVTDQIIEATGRETSKSQPVDTAEIVDIIDRGRRVSDMIPGFQDSLADRTGNPGIAALEYGRQSGQNSGIYATRRSDNTTAIDAAMNRNAPDGSAGAFRSELELERDRRLSDAEIVAANARDVLERSTQNLRPGMTGEARGADIRASLEAASARANDQVRDAWEPINQSGQQVDVGPLAQRFGELGDAMSMAERARFAPPEVGIPAQLAQTGEHPLREVTGLRSALTDAAREAATAGRSNEARIAGQHVDAIDDFLGGSIPPELAEQYATARAARRDYGDRFERPQTAIAQTLDRQQGMYRQPDSGVAGKFVQPDEGRIADFEALIREGGQDIRVQGAVRDQILADVSDRGLLERPEQLDAYLGRYGAVFGRFPELRTELGNAGALRREFAGAESAHLDLMREIGPQGRGNVARYLQHGDENADRAMKAVIAAKEPGKAADELLTFVNDDPNAVLGARKTFWDILQKSARSRGETTATMAGDQPWMPKALQGFLDDPRASAVAERLWRDNPEHLENVREIAAAIQNVDVRARAKAPNTSGTAQGVNPLLTPEALQSRWYAFRSGRISGSFLLTSIAAVTGRRAVARAQSTAISRMLDEALLNPDAASVLLQQNNPANRAALARKAKGWLGNEATTFLQLMEADVDKDRRS